MMQHYELMYILPGSVEMEQVAGIKAAVMDLVKATGATVTAEVDMDRRRLAYRMGQESYGYYHVMQFDVDANAIKELDAKLRLENRVMRFMLVKSVAQTVERIQELLAGEKYKRQRPQSAAAVAATGKTEQTSATALTEAEMEFAKSASSKRSEEVVEEDKKVSIEELDKKLDAILEDSDLDKKL